MRSMLGNFCSPTVLVCGFLLLAGCGGGADNSPPRAAVSGTVLLDDQPLKKGVVNFIPTGETKGPMTTAPVENGKYSLSEELGPLVGTHRVEIESRDSGGVAMDDEQAIQRLKQQGVKRLQVVKVPAAYNTRSQLTATIKAETENQFDFPLSSKPD